MNSLRNKIFIFFVVLLLIVQAVALWAIRSSADVESQQSIDSRLKNASDIFNKIYESRNEKLVAVAQTAAQDTVLQENFNDNQRSFLYALNSHRERIEADLAIVLDDRELIKAQLINRRTEDGLFNVTQGDEVGKPFYHPNWLDIIYEDYLYEIDGQLFQVSVAPVKVGSDNIGWVLFGFSIDHRLASTFSELTQLVIDFVVVKNGHVENFSSSSSPVTSVGLLRKILADDVPNDRIATYINIHEFGVDQNKNLKVVLHGSKSDPLELVNIDHSRLTLIIVVALILALGGAYVISSSVTRPIRQLVEWSKHIANGSYDEPAGISDRGEIGQLAKEFRSMQNEIITREKAIAHQAYYHPLTDLPNRSQLIKSVDAQIKLNVREIAFLNVNVSHVSEINKSLGHRVGDQIIKEVASRLSGTIDRGKLYHVGGDEFVVLMLRADKATIDKYLGLIDGAVSSPYRLEAMTLPLRVVVGVVMYPRHANNAEEMLQKSDVAIQLAKSKKQDFMIYDPSQDVDTLDQLSLMSDLRIALKENQLLLYYQPKVNLATRQVESVEALVRWDHPDLGMITPDRFISLAERTGQIHLLTYWVFEEAVSQCAKWVSDNIPLKMAINISAENLKEEGFFDRLSDLVDKHKVPVGSIILEITENAFVEDPDEAIAVLTRLRLKGFKLSIDDYGTGYSSLAQLKDLPVDELKIDMSFIRRLPDDEGDKIIVRSTIDLAHNMGLTVVAEGVENKQALAWLTYAKCEIAQGYFITRPLPVRQFESWLKKTPFYDYHGRDRDSS